MKCLTTSQCTLARPFTTGHLSARPQNRSAQAGCSTSSACSSTSYPSGACAASWRASGRQRDVTAAAGEPMGETAPGVEAGTRIRVTADVIVYHVPKLGGELSLKVLLVTVQVALSVEAAACRLVFVLACLIYLSYLAGIVLS